MISKALVSYKEADHTFWRQLKKGRLNSSNLISVLVN